MFYIYLDLDLIWEKFCRTVPPSRSGDSLNPRNMSIRLPNLAVCADDDSGSQSGSSSDDDQDQSWDDFAEESIAQQPCLSLFEDKQFPSVTEALEYDRNQHNFDLDGICSRLCASSFEFAGQLVLRFLPCM